METNECLENNGGCWQDKTANITACRVSFISMISNGFDHAGSWGISFDFFSCLNLFFFLAFV